MPLSEKILVSVASPSDAEAILAVRKQVWLQHYPSEIYGITREDLELKDFDSPSKVADLQSELTNNPNLRVFVAKDGNQVIGCLFTRKAETYNEGENFYILESYQGQGIGTQMSKFGLDWIGQEKDIVIGVVAYNLPAVESYKKMGFIPVGEILHDEGLLPNGKVIPGIKMVRSARSEDLPTALG